MCARDGGGLVTGVAPNTMQPGSLWAQTTSGESPATCQLLAQSPDFSLPQFPLYPA